MFFTKFIISHFKLREFMHKFFIKATCRKIDIYVNSDRVVRDIEHIYEESASGNWNDSDERIQTSFP